LRYAIVLGVFVFSSRLYSAHVAAVTVVSEVSESPKKPEGMGWRVAVSIVAFFGSIIAVILWLFFFAGSFNGYQNIAVIVVIFLAFIAVMGATWASWGMKQSAWWNQKANS
jgi:hypothetical protein